MAGRREERLAPLALGAREHDHKIKIHVDWKLKVPKRLIPYSPTNGMGEGWQQWRNGWGRAVVTVTADTKEVMNKATKGEEKKKFSVVRSGRERKRREKDDRGESGRKRNREESEDKGSSREDRGRRKARTGDGNGKEKR